MIRLRDFAFKDRDNVMIYKRLIFRDEKNCFTTCVTSLSCDSGPVDNYLLAFLCIQISISALQLLDLI